MGVVRRLTYNTIWHSIRIPAGYARNSKQEKIVACISRLIAAVAVVHYANLCGEALTEFENVLSLVDQLRCCRHVTRP